MGDIAKLSKSDNELKEEKRVRKKIIALCLAGVMAVMPIAGMGGTMAYAENTNTVENSSPSVSTMKLNLLEAPLGVDKENLSFSWAMEDCADITQPVSHKNSPFFIEASVVPTTI